MGTPPLLQTMLVTSSLRITCLHHTNGWPTLSAAYVCMFFLQHDWVTLRLWVRHLQNHWTTLRVWVSNINRCVCLGALPTESLGYTTLIGVQPQVQPMTVMSTYTITGSQKIYGCLTISVTPHIWVCNLKGSLCWLALPKESLSTLHLWVCNVKFSLLLLASPTE